MNWDDIEKNRYEPASSFNQDVMVISRFGARTMVLDVIRDLKIQLKAKDRKIKRLKNQINALDMM